MTEKILNPLLGKKTYEEAPSLEAVQAEFVRRGHNLDLSSTCDQAFHDWYLHNRRKGLGADGFPATTVMVNGVQYHIHGISHDEQINDTVRKYIRGELERYLSLEHVVLMEQGVSSLIFRGYIDNDPRLEITFVDLPVVEMDDQSWAKKVDHKGVRRFREKAKMWRPPTTDYDVEDIGCEVCNHIQADSVDTYNRSMGDQTCLADLQNYVFSTHLPEQLHRQYLELFYPEEALMVSGRSRRMAEFASQYETRSREIDMVVGAAHQPGIAYYLQEL